MTTIYKKSLFLIMLSILVFSYSDGSPIESKVLGDCESAFRAWPTPDGASIVISGIRVINDDEPYKMHETFLRVMNLETGKIVSVDGHQKYGGGGYTIGFSPDGIKAISGGNSFAAILWNVATGKTIHEFLMDDQVTPFAVDAVTFTGDGNYIVVVAKRILRVYDSRNYSIVFEQPYYDVYGATMYPNENKFILRDTNSAKIMDCNGKFYFEVPSTGLRVSSDKQFIYSLASIEFGKWVFCKYDLKTGKLLYQSKVFSENHEGMNLVISPNGKSFFFYDEPKIYRILDNGEIQSSKTVLNAKDEPVSIISFTTDSKRILGKRDCEISIYDVDDLFSVSAATEKNK